MAAPQAPLLAWTLAGLIGCGLLATLHPTEAFDPARIDQQVGRNVRVSAEARSVKVGEDWRSGLAVVDTDAGAITFSWVWFRPPDGAPQTGDRLDGLGRVTRQDGSAGIQFEGAFAAAVSPGPHPVVVRWKDLLAAPDHYEGRALALAGSLDANALVAPDGQGRCPLSRGLPDGWPQDANGRFLVRLVAAAELPAWTCAPLGVG